MTPNEWLLDETRGWVRRAPSDLRAAEICATEPPATALFHCQQAAEKYLKACLTWNQTAFRKTHDLKELAAACARIDPALQSALDSAMALSKCAWKTGQTGDRLEVSQKRRNFESVPGLRRPGSGVRPRSRRTSPSEHLKPVTASHVRLMSAGQRGPDGHGGQTGANRGTGWKFRNNGETSSQSPGLRGSSPARAEAHPPNE